MTERTTWDTQPELRTHIERLHREVLDQLDPGLALTPLTLRDWVRGERRLSDGGYSKRQVLELLQNGVDAAARTGARITVLVRGGHLYVANTGTPLTLGGINALLTMNNSPKSGEIGKFGLGFKSLLRLSDKIDIISRSVSMRFDRKAAEQTVFTRHPALRGNAIPMMRLAWPLAPDEEQAADHELASLMEVHDTVVKISLRDDEAHATVGDELTELRHEFLLFTGKDIAFDCAGREVRVLHEPGDVLVLHSGQTPSRWKVFHDVATLREDETAARRDAGDLYATDGLALAWAVPLDLDAREGHGQIWSFFPLAEKNRVPGILNAPFKTTDDRSNLFDGPYNHALFDRCAALIVASLPALRGDDDPARHLDYLPRDMTGNELASNLADRVWRKAREAALVPDVDGTLRPRARFRSPPTQDTALLVAWGEIAPQRERERSPHPLVFRKDALGRAGRGLKLLGIEAREDASSWLAAVASSDAATAAKVIDLADKLRSSDPRLADSSKTWRIVPDSAGVLREGPSLLLDGDASDQRVLPALASDPALRAALLGLGVREKNAAWHREQLIAARLRGNWELFWKLWRHAPAGARVSEGLLVRTRAGSWKRGNLCVIGNDLLDGLGAVPAGDPAMQFLADTTFHTIDELAAADMETDGDFELRRDNYFESSVFREWASWAHSDFRTSHRGVHKPRVLESGAISLLLDLIQCERYRERLTAWISDHTMESAFYGNPRNREKYPDPEAWALQRYGRWNGASYPLVWLVRDEAKLCEHLGVAQDSIKNVVDALLKWASPAPIEQSAARSQLAVKLGPDMLRDVPPEARTALYEAGARVGVIPDVFLVGAQRVAKKDLRVSNSAVNEPRVLVVPSGSIEAFERCGVQLHLSAFIDTEEWFWRIPPDFCERGEYIETVPVDEHLPWLTSVLKPDVEANVALYRVDSNDEGGVAVGDGKMKFFVSDNTVPARDNVLRVAQQLGWLRLDPAAALSAIAESEQLRATACQTSATGLAERLLQLVGGPQLKAQLEEIQALPSGLSGARIAETFLWTFGVGALRELEAPLRSRRFGPPTRWGTAAARAFAAGLGFPQEFGGSPTSRREPSIEVDGPIPYAPLHDFQREVRNELTLVLNSQGTRAMVCLPTGAGKTRVVVEAVVEEVLRRADGPRLVLWVAQQDELCEQAVQTFRTLWRTRGTDETLTIGRLWDSNRPTAVDGAQVIVATIQTLLRRFDDPAYAWLQKPAVVVIDEAHHAIAKSYTELLKWLETQQKRGVPVIGLSATPHRGASLDETLRLTKRFGGKLIPDADRQPTLHDTLIERRVLARAHHAILEHIAEQMLNPEELEHLNTFHDLPSSVCERLGDSADRNEKILSAALDESAQRTLLFAASVRHARWLAIALNARGCPAAAIDGSTPTANRRYFLRAFREGRVRVLVNYGVLTTGFDEPLVDTVIIARPTFSPVLYAQMMGRGLRGTANGGTEACDIVTVRDNWNRYQDHPAWKWFAEHWRLAGVPLVREPNPSAPVVWDF